MTTTDLRKGYVTGFTLVELLVVIGIIGMLIALLMPALSGARAMARKTKARTELGQIETALKAFYNDYRRFPTSVVKLDRRLLMVLRGDSPGENPRATRYLEFDGDLAEGFLDPLGTVYRAAVDDDGDNDVDNADHGEGYLRTSSDPKRLFRNAAAWSWGPNRLQNRQAVPEEDDNIVTWKKGK